MAQQMTDPYDRLDEEYAPSLPRMTAGDRFSGKVLKIDRRTGEYSTYPILTVELARVTLSDHPDIQPGQAVSWHALHSVAQSELAQLKVKPGETIAVQYLGQRDSKNGSGSYHAWKVVADRPVDEFDWSTFTGEEDAKSEAPPSDDPASFDPPKDLGDDIPF